MAKIKEFADAGFDHVHVHQVGADQETLFRHLPGALHISLKELDEQTAAALDRSRPVITYCYDYE